MANRAFIQTQALIVDTFREASARKIIWGFFGCSTALILFFLVIVKIDIVQGSLAAISVFGKTQTRDATTVIKQAYAAIASFLFGFGMLLAILASAGLIPTIFEPGRIELLLSKPVERWHVLLGRFAGNLIVVGLNMFYPVLAVWIIFGVKTGIWTFGFLWGSLLAVFMFAVYLSVILLVGVVWESAVVSTMITFAMIIISIILWNKSALERLLSSEWSRNAVRFFYYLLPKVVDIGRMLTRIVMEQPVDDWMPFWSTALFGLACLGSGLWIFQRRNF